MLQQISTKCNAPLDTAPKWLSSIEIESSVEVYIICLLSLRFGRPASEYDILVRATIQWYLLHVKDQGNNCWLCILSMLPDPFSSCDVSTSMASSIEISSSIVFCVL